MPRDRLDALRQIQARDEFTDNGEERPNGPLPTRDVTIEMETRDGLSSFLIQVEDIHELLSEFKADVEFVKRKHSEILSSPNTDDPRRRQLDEYTAKIKANTNKIRSKLKYIEAEIKKDEQDTEYSETQIRIKKTQHSALLRAFIDTMNIYQSAQSEFREACKSRIKRQIEITGKSYEDQEIEDIMEQGNWSIFTEGIMAQTAQSRQMLADIEARHNDIIQLEKSIKELHEMFVEMAMLVESQGEQIDRIDYHVTTAQTYVEKAKQETHGALELQSSARKKQIMIIAFLILVVLLIVLVIWFTS